VLTSESRIGSGVVRKVIREGYDGKASRILGQRLRVMGGLTMVLPHAQGAGLGAAPAQGAQGVAGSRRGGARAHTMEHAYADDSRFPRLGMAGQGERQS
jgi:hypothetical protein